MPLLLCLSLLAQDALAGEVDALLAELASEKIERRSEARRRLVERMKSADRAKARALLAERLKAATDEEVRGALAEAWGPLAGLDDVGLELVLPAAPIPLREARTSFTFKVRIRNASPVRLVLSAYRSLDVLGADGKAVEGNLAIGRWGVRPDGCFLEAQPFLSLAPGEIHEAKASLKFYDSDPEMMLGWSLPAAGAYTLRVTYAFDRAACRSRCRSGCAGHEEPRRPWSRALEGKKSVEAKLEVREETPKEREASAAVRRRIEAAIEEARRTGQGGAGIFGLLQDPALTEDERQALTRALIEAMEKK